MIHLADTTIVTANADTAIIAIRTAYSYDNNSMPCNAFSFIITQNQMRELGTSLIAQADLMTTLPEVQVAP